MDMFSGESFVSLARSLKLNFSVADSEYPKSSYIIDNCHQILSERLNEIKTKVGCALAVAIAWATNIENCTHNINGFSPSQLVFGFNLVLPCVNTDKPPTLSNESYHALLVDHLNEQKKAFDAFNKMQASKRFRRALDFDSKCCNSSFLNGDKVFYRQKGDEWQGPGIVISQNHQFVLIRLQNNWVRIHPDNLQLAKWICPNNQHHKPYKETENKWWDWL